MSEEMDDDLKRMHKRVSTWFDLKMLDEQYGVQIDHPDHSWINAADNGGPIFFKTREEAASFIQRNTLKD